jgi:predicted esterase
VRTLAPTRRRFGSLAGAFLAALGCASGPPGTMSTRSNQDNPVDRALPQVTVEAGAPAAGQTVMLDVPGYLPAVVWVPGGDPRAPKPIVVATHGAYDSPEAYCPFWQKIVGDRAFVLCTRGKRVEEGQFFYPNHLFVDSEDAVALSALRSRFGGRTAPGPILYAGYSQGATHGAPLLQMRPRAHPRAVLIEGGSQWNARSAKQYRAGGGERILFVCGTQGCRTNASRAVSVLTKAGLQVDFLWVPRAGHDYPLEMALRIASRLEWLVAGDPQWSTK